MRELIFVDTESTGLDANVNELVEVSWAPLYGDITTLYLGVETVPAFIDDLIGFTARGIAGRKSESDEWADFLNRSQDNTMVAANPAHDKAFLEAFGLFKFHYRMLDIETYAMAKLDLEEMPGMKSIYDLLVDMGHDITTPDHSSANDVAAMRDAYLILNGF